MERETESRVRKEDTGSLEPSSWIADLAFVIFERVVGTSLWRLAIYVKRPLDADEIADLMVEAELSVRTPGLPSTIRFAVKEWRTEERADKSYLLTLRPFEEEDALTSRNIREEKNEAFSKPRNVRSVKLCLGGQSRTYFDSGDGHYFADCSLPRPQTERTGCA